MRRRLIWLLAIGFFMATVLTAVIQGWFSFRQTGDNKSVAGEIAVEELNRTITPARFQSISQIGNEIRLSGNAESEATIVIMNKESSVRQVRATKEGNWTANIQIVPNEVMEISINIALANGQLLQTDETLLRIPYSAQPVEVASGTAAQSAPVTTPVPALALLPSPGGASRILQSPFGPRRATDILSLGPVEYDDLGAVIFSGQAERQGRVRIYIDGNVIGDTRVAADGRWFYIRADTLAVGSYEMVVELTPPDEESVELKQDFERMAPQSGELSNQIFVKQDEDRWQIRRQLKGGGTQYTTIFSPKDTEPTSKP